MLRTLTASLVAASLLLVPSLASAEACAVPTATVAPAAAKIEGSSGGGVLVLQTYDRYGLPSSAGAVMQDGWRFRTNGKLVKPVIENVAPGSPFTGCPMAPRCRRS